MNWITFLLRFCASIAAFSCMAVATAADSDDGIVEQCLWMQKENPDQAQGGRDECKCVAQKLSGFLTDDHYELLAAYDATIVEIANRLSNLKGPEYTARALKAVAAMRDESPTLVTRKLAEIRPVTSPAYVWCGVFPSQ